MATQIRAFDWIDDGTITIQSVIDPELVTWPNIVSILPIRVTTGVAGESGVTTYKITLSN